MESKLNFSLTNSTRRFVSVHYLLIKGSKFP